MLATFLVFLKLGCMSFGGPIAHLGYFRDEFVRRRRWLTESQFAQCIAITQLLPGPASSQTGMLIGLLHAGWPGSVCAWAGFTLPSAVLMTAFALWAPPGFQGSSWMHGLLIAAVAVVASAILTMRQQLVRSLPHLCFAFATAAAVLTIRNAAAVPISIALCALIALAFPAHSAAREEALALRVSRTTAVLALVVFVALLVLLPIAARLTANDAIALAAKMFSVGSLVFGGGHVVLPLLQSQVVNAGIAPEQRLIAGYAAAQALPGPLFTISSYIGAIADHGRLGIAGAVTAILAIFAPSFFLIAGVAPFYSALAQSERFHRALGGANASVVGLLAAAFVAPIWTTAIHTIVDGLIAAAAFVALAALRWPNWLVVALCVAAGFIFLR